MITLTVNGAEGILTAKERINSMVERGITNMCLAIEAEAKERCPVRDGTLRRSITTEVAVEAEQIEGKVGTNLDYAPYIHEGTGIYSRTGAGRKDVPWVYRDAAGNFYTTSGIHPHPFLEEAAMDVSTRITEFFGEV